MEAYSKPILNYNNNRFSTNTMNGIIYDLHSDEIVRTLTSEEENDLYATTYNSLIIHTRLLNEDYHQYCRELEDWLQKRRYNLHGSGIKVFF